MVTAAAPLHKDAAHKAEDSQDGARIFLFDSTLRDGAQTVGVDFCLADKMTIARALDRLKIDYIEGGWPGTNDVDTAFFADPPRLSSARLVAFGMTRRAGRSVENDPDLSCLLESGAATLCLVGKASRFQVATVLQVAGEENLAMIKESVARLVAAGREVIFDAEHFFDGMGADPDYALACLKAADDAGARWLVLCDTNGGSLPTTVSVAVARARAHLPTADFGIHSHNDSALAEANSLAALDAGARQLQGTLNGLGERCGNANLTSLIPTLALKTAYRTAVGADQLRLLTPIAQMLNERLNRPPQNSAPYVGSNAFSHKGGLHGAAVARDPRTYEHIPPERVGNARQVVVSQMAGRANLAARLQDLGIDIPSPLLGKLLKEIKQRSAKGLTYDGADASLELCARRLLGQVPEFFSLLRFRVIDERRWNARGQLITESEATVTVRIADRELMQVATGSGPVEALDRALCAALAPQYPDLLRMKLVDYKVRILDPESGVAAHTRVMIESRDENKRTWCTVGVSANIIDASYSALYDAIVWHLLHSAPPDTRSPTARSQE